MQSQVSQVHMRSPTIRLRPHKRDSQIGADLDGIVTHVRDGDTIEVEGVPVRLRGTSASEMNEPFGKAAKEFMVHLVMGQTARCKLDGSRTHGWVVRFATS